MIEILLGLLKIGAAKVWAFLCSLPWQVWVGLALVAVVLTYGSWRYDVGQADVQARWDAERVELTAAAREARTKAVQQRQARITRGRAILKQLREGNTDAHARRDDLVADLGAGRVRVLERFRCPGAAPAADARVGSGGGDAAEKRGLSAADGAFLVRFATEADDVVRQLHACQATLSADRSQFAMPSKPTAIPVSAD